MSTATSENPISVGGVQFSISRPHSFGLIIDGPLAGGGEDYLHKILLSPTNRESFLALIETEGLVVCKNIRTQAPSYRKVRGKSSYGKLSQAEYYHHDGCSCPTKPRVVEIRLPHQDIARNVATAVARFPDVIHAMIVALPERLRSAPNIKNLRRHLLGETATNFEATRPVVETNGFSPVETWDKIQGQVTRLVRREMDAESCRAYFRAVDQIAGAYDLPWEMGESRLMLNSHDDLAKTMQHRRAYQKPRESNEQNGSLVKRWTAEEA